MKETLPMDPDVGLKRTLCCERFATDFTRKWLLTLKKQENQDKTNRENQPPPQFHNIKKNKGNTI